MFTQEIPRDGAETPRKKRVLYDSEKQKNAHVRSQKKKKEGEDLRRLDYNGGGPKKKEIKAPYKRSKGQNEKKGSHMKEEALPKVLLKSPTSNTPIFNETRLSLED